MTIDEVYGFYGTITKAAEAVNVNRVTFYAWMKAGNIPYNQQKRYEKLSNGKLIADKNLKEFAKTLKEINNFPLFRYYSEEIGMCNVHSISFFKNKSHKIVYYYPLNNQIKFSSFNAKNLMQSTKLFDSKNTLLYEGDIVLIGKKEFKFNKINDYELLIAIRDSKNFLIIGNIFEGKK